jgi:hypothetical protein
MSPICRVLLVVLFGSASIAFAETPKPVVGIGSHLLTPEAIAQLKELGIAHVRTTLLWPLWKHPTYPLSFAENVKRAHDAGLKLLIAVHNWPGDAPVFESGVNRNMMREFAQFVADRAKQFPDVEGWQLWNEQDLWVQAPFGASDHIDMRQRGRLYAEQLALAYPLIKKASPHTLVVSGGTADDPGSGFLEGMMESRPPVDAIAIHAYGAWPAARERIMTARRIVGDHAPIWVTECGQDAEDKVHLDVWRQVLQGNDTERLAARIYPYVLFTAGVDNHGLIRGDNSRRPTFDWMRQWLLKRNSPQEKPLLQGSRLE